MIYVKRPHAEFYMYDTYILMKRNRHENEFINILIVDLSLGLANHHHQPAHHHKTFDTDLAGVGECWVNRRCITHASFKIIHPANRLIRQLAFTLTNVYTHHIKTQRKNSYNNNFALLNVVIFYL